MALLYTESGWCAEINNTTDCIEALTQYMKHLWIEAWASTHFCIEGEDDISFVRATDEERCNFLMTGIENSIAAFTKAFFEGGSDAKDKAKEFSEGLLGLYGIGLQTLATDQRLEHFASTMGYFNNMMLRNKRDSDSIIAQA